MKALFCSAPHTLEVQDRDEPMIEGPEDVIVEVKAVGICGSDGGRYHWTNALLKMPHIGGHEYSGVVRAVGTAVAARYPQIAPGVRVAGLVAPAAQGRASR